MNEDVNAHINVSVNSTESRSVDSSAIAETLELLRSHSQITLNNNNYSVNTQNSNNAATNTANNHISQSMLYLSMPNHSSMKSPANTNHNDTFTNNDRLNDFFRTYDSDSDDGEYLPHSYSDDTNKHETVAYRTRARHPLTEYTIDELEATLNEALDNYDHNIDDSMVGHNDEYKQFIESTLQSSATAANQSNDSSSEDEIFVPSGEDELIGLSDNQSDQSNISTDDEFTNTQSVRISKRELRDLRRDRANIQSQLNTHNTVNIHNVQSMPTRRMMQQNQSNNSVAATPSLGDTPLRRSRRTGTNTLPSPANKASINQLPQSNRTLQFHSSSNDSNHSLSAIDRDIPLHEQHINILPSNLQPKNTIVTIAKETNTINAAQSAIVINAAIQASNTHNITAALPAVQSSAEFTASQIATLRKQIRNHIQLLMQTRVLAQTVHINTTSIKHKRMMNNVVDTMTLCLNEMDVKSQLSHVKYNIANIASHIQPILQNNLLQFWCESYQTEQQMLNRSNHCTTDTTPATINNSSADTQFSSMTDEFINDSITDVNRAQLDSQLVDMTRNNKSVLSTMNRWWDIYANIHSFDVTLRYELCAESKRWVWSAAEDLLLAAGLKRFGRAQQTPHTLFDSVEFNKHTDWSNIKRRYLPAYNISQIKDRVNSRINKSTINPIKQILDSATPKLLTMTSHEISQLRLGVQQYTSIDGIISWSSIRDTYLPHWTANHIRVMYNKLYNNTNLKAKELRLRRRMKSVGIDVSRKNKHKFQQYDEYLRRLNVPSDLNNQSHNTSSNNMEIDVIEDIDDNDSCHAHDHSMNQQLLADVAADMDGTEIEELESDDNNCDDVADLSYKENYDDIQTTMIMNYINNSDVNNNDDNGSFELNDIADDESEISTSRVSINNYMAQIRWSTAIAHYNQLEQQHKHLLADHTHDKRRDRCKKHKTNTIVT